MVLVYSNIYHCEVNITDALIFAMPDNIGYYSRKSNCEYKIRAGFQKDYIKGNTIEIEPFRHFDYFKIATINLDFKNQLIKSDESLEPSIGKLNQAIMYVSKEVCNDICMYIVSTLKEDGIVSPITANWMDTIIDKCVLEADRKYDDIITDLSKYNSPEQLFTFCDI